MVIVHDWFAVMVHHDFFWIAPVVVPDQNCSLFSDLESKHFLLDIQWTRSSIMAPVSRRHPCRLQADSTQVRGRLWVAWMNGLSGVESLSPSLTKQTPRNPLIHHPHVFSTMIALVALPGIDPCINHVSIISKQNGPWVINCSWITNR